LVNGNYRLDRNERILEPVTKNQEDATATLNGVTVNLQEVTTAMDEMAARQQYRDETLERHDAAMKFLREPLTTLALIAGSHHRRLINIAGGAIA